MSLDKTQLSLLSLLIETHDGDDRCGCLGFALIEACNGDPETALAIVRECHYGHTPSPWSKS